MTSFKELGLSAEVLRALDENGFKDPFPIQELSIPLILKGMDVIGQAHTGTGKTAAFSLPILNNIKRNGPIQALILVPTRELAMQVTNEIRKFSKYVGIRTLAVYGGQSMSLQITQLRKGVQIVVATPGRLIDHVKRGTIQLEAAKFVVLDEADRMLDMGFIDDIKFILFYVDEDRQTCLFSATIPAEISRLARDYMKNPHEVKLNEEEIGLDTIDQSYLIVEERQKFKHLCNFIRTRDEKQTLVFAATKQRTQRLAIELKQQGLRAITIHGDLSQKQRDDSMHRFRTGSEDILVATDIAARGIDVPAIGHVINYDIPDDPLIYFHRIGRTARAGGTGKAISLVSQDRVDDFTRILKNTELPIKRLNDEMGIEVPRIQSHPRTNWRRNSGYGGRYGSGGGYRNRQGSNRFSSADTSRRRYGYGARSERRPSYNQRSSYDRT
ncbi:MAG: DEAD/DEAH box helicase [Nitrososphaerota archaeon]